LPRGTDFLAVCAAAVLEFVSTNVLVGMDKNGRAGCVLRLAGLGRNARCDLVLALALRSLRHLTVHVLNKCLFVYSSVTLLHSVDFGSSVLETGYQNPKDRTETGQTKQFER
jgi:hypothetical protein